MAEPTPGQRAYAAYWPALGTAPPVPWDGLSPVVHRAWEAAAQAVLALVRPTPEPSQVTAAVDAGAAIVQAINAREAASLEALRQEAEEETHG